MPESTPKLGEQLPVPVFCQKARRYSVVDIRQTEDGLVTAIIAFVDKYLRPKIAIVKYARRNENQYIIKNAMVFYPDDIQWLATKLAEARGSLAQLLS